jgi:hypothetical protein
MLGNDMIHVAIGSGVPDRYLEFLQEEGPWAVVRELPSLAAFTELHRVRYPDTQRPWTANDYHDIRFLSVALAYCDAACPDRAWADAARRSQWIADRGVVVASGHHAIGDALQQLEAG